MVRNHWFFPLPRKWTTRLNRPNSYYYYLFNIAFFGRLLYIYVYIYIRVCVRVAAVYRYRMCPYYGLCIMYDVFDFPSVFIFFFLSPATLSVLCSSQGSVLSAHNGPRRRFIYTENDINSVRNSFRVPYIWVIVVVVVVVTGFLSL